MVKQYSHTATVTITEPATKQANGDYVPASSSTLPDFVCRAEPATGSGYVVGVDGKRVDFSWVVYFKNGPDIIPQGSAITINDEAGNQLLADKVKQFSKGQINSRIWL